MKTIATRERTGTSEHWSLNSFPRSERYHKFLQPSYTIHEAPSPYTENFSERHLHCVWADDHLRPPNLHSFDGQDLEVLHPGQWNHEAGPDFKAATLRIGGQVRVCDVEIHIRPMDWRNHRHHLDARYKDVGLHVCYYEGSLPIGLLPTGCIETSLQKELDRRSHFFFESIDTQAYPWDKDGHLTPLRQTFEGLADEERAAVLDAAGEERLRRKTVNVAHAIEALGASQVLYSRVLRALGYKHNADNGEQLANALPIHELRDRSACSPLSAAALLLGVSGLLPDPTCASLSGAHVCDAEQLWGVWFRNRDTLAPRSMTKDDWHLHAMRPSNHPRLRLGAAALLFTQEPRIEEELLQENPDAPLRMRDWIQRIDPRPADISFPFSPIGRERAAAILVNAVLPYVAAQTTEPLSPELLSLLPQEANNQKVRAMAHSLFGPDHNPKLYTSTLRKQGLLQFYEDFGA